MEIYIINEIKYKAIFRSEISIYLLNKLLLPLYSN